MTGIRKSWRDTLPIHPAAERFPLMSEAELRVTGEDIRHNGLREAPVLIKEEIGPQKFKFSLIDGRNRLDAMELVGIDFEIRHSKRGRGQVYDVWEIDVIDDGLDDDDDIPTPLLTSNPIVLRVVSNVDPYAYSDSANLHRRHLTPEEKRERIEKLIVANPEKSDRQIGGMAKVGKNVINRTRKKLEATGTVGPVEKRVGADGKSRRQPARTSKKKASPTENDTGARLQLLELAFDELNASDLDIEKALPLFLKRVQNDPALLVTCVKEYLIQAAHTVRDAQEKAAEAEQGEAQAPAPSRMSIEELEALDTPPKKPPMH